MLEENEMKLKSLIWTMGVKPRTREYASRRIAFHVENIGNVAYAKWEHPSDYFQPFGQSRIDELSSFIAQGDTVLDIGAHTGDYTVPFALAAGVNGCVFALEPNPYVFKILEENANLNRDKTNIIPVNAAATEKDGPLEFSYSDPGYCNGGLFEGFSKWQHGHPYKLKVAGVQLADWLDANHKTRISRISYIKIDTEGQELSIIRSLRGLIAKTMPTLHLEMFRRLPPDRRLELLMEIQNLGYNAHRSGGKHDLLPGIKLNEQNLSAWESYDIIAIPR